MNNLETNEKSLLLELKEISSGYEGNTIIKDINLKLYDRDFIAVIGPNGGGKTTLIKTIVGLITPSKGQIEWHTKEDKSHSIFGYLPQINQIDRSFPISVLDVVLSGKINKNRLINNSSSKDKEEAISLLKEMGVDAFANQNIGKLSGGQLQRVFLDRKSVV